MSNKRSTSMMPFGGNGRGGQGNSSDQLSLFRGGGDPFQEMDRMAQKMMRDFDMPMMKASSMFGGRDPFRDDPFFNNDMRSGGFGGFQDIESKMMKMMSNSRKMMEDVPKMGSGNGQGQFVSQSYVSSTVLGPDGRPIQQKYGQKVAGAIGNGNKVIERQQMYDNSATGLQKASHERMLNGQGRKIVKERVGQNQNAHDFYKNLREEEAHEFDNRWDQAARQVGLPTSTANNRLGYGMNQQSSSFGGNQRQNYTPSNAIHYDDGRHGAYVDQRMRDPNMPVNFNRNQRAAIDISPTQPMERGGIMYQNNNIQRPTNIQNNQQPLAISDGRQNNIRAANQVRHQAQNNNNYNVPKAKGPAKAF
eukprot:403338814